MAKKQVFAEKFAKINKRLIKGRLQHTRTGACTARGKCYHGMVKRPQ